MSRKLSEITYHTLCNDHLNSLIRLMTQINNVFRGIIISAADKKLKTMTVKEKEKRTGNAIHVQSDTK